MTREFLLRSCALITFCAPVTVLAAERLNVKTGLWEITSVTQMSGALPLPKDLRDKMTAEQLAQMAQGMKEEAAKGPTRDTSRECVTQKDIEHPFSSANSEECRQTIVKTSRTSQEARLVCDGEHKGAGLLRINTPTPDTMNGTIDLTMGEGAETFTIKSSLSGHWLTADCGNEADDSGDVDADDEPADDNEEEEE